jgi:two-component system, LytTR family, response regulator
MKLRALIADDEPLARERLRYLLSPDEEIEIVGECRNGREVIATLRDSSPESGVDLLFLDIQMPGRGGFEVIEQIGAESMPVIVFVTAHSHYAIEAFEVHALDYLTKPIEAERLRATVHRVKERVAANRALATQQQLRSILAALESSDQLRRDYPARLLVPNGAKDSFVTVNDIDWIEAADYYAHLHVGAKSFMFRETIKHLANTLDPRKFVRIHRSVIVNVGRVREIVREGSSEGAVILKGGQRLRMSKAGWHALIALSRGTSRT